MAQQTDPHLTDREQAILDAAVRECGLPGFADALGSRDAWGDRVQIAFASDDRRLLLKQWPVYCRTDDEIGNVIALQDMVREAGVPVPRLLRTEAGSRVFDWSDARFSIAEFVGDAYDPEQPSQKIECARMLGRFHAAVADVRYHTDWGRDPVWISRNHLRRMAESAEADGSPSTVSKAVTDAARGMDALLVVAEKRLDQYGWRELHRIPVHGDYHHFNCRFDGSEVVAVVDFDDSRLEPRPYDVAYAIGMMLSLDWRVEPTGARWQDCRVPDDASLLLAASVPD